MGPEGKVTPLFHYLLDSSTETHRKVKWTLPYPPSNGHKCILTGMALFLPPRTKYVISENVFHLVRISFSK